MPQDDTRRISRRAALQLGAGAGVSALAAPYLLRSATRGHAFDIADAQLTMTPTLTWPVPRMITRAQWGANEALRKPGQVYDGVIQKIVVHHTGTPNDVTDYAGLARGILANETAGEYIDIAYNWLIDPLGNIYEGRWAQDYPSGAAHTGERNGANVRGGHAIYHNTNTIGIALMGNYDAIDPPAAMLDALVTLLAWKCARWGLNPLAHGTYDASNGAVEDLYNICGHRDTSATACPGAHTEALLPNIRARVAARIFGGGYWIASNMGQVVPFGGVPNGVNTNGRKTAAIAGHPSGDGYWLAAPDGTVYASGAARNFGGMHGRWLAAPIIGMASTITGNGYWLVGGDGGIFTFGDAKFYGSTGNKRLNAPVLGMLSTASGKGYWLFARDGGIFSFGDAKFMGSTGNKRLNSPIVAMATRPQGDGYWLVGGDGGIFTFGNAPFVGSGANARRLPCVGMLPTTTGKGYALLRADGTVDSYGDAPNLGGANGLLYAFTAAVGIAGKLKPF